jgi:3',5'-cyclic-nucleotide phosphodiesterase
MKYFLPVICLLLCSSAFAQQTAFKVIPLGVKGGADESNLSAYLVAPQGSDSYICLDAGTLHAGLQKAVDNGLFKKTAGEALRQNIKGYCISHPHLDHVAGLIINSPDDTAKTIYGLPFCLDVIQDKYFSWKSWANFGDAGEMPQLKKYHYYPLTPRQATPLAQTGLSVQAYPLSHSATSRSTAFLLRVKNAYLLYLGDTGADAVEKSDKLLQLWQTVAPLLKARQLKAIFIEVSFPEEQPRSQLFGHLTPGLLMQEMHRLDSLAGPHSVNNLPVVITHIKPSGNNEAMIRKQVAGMNKPGLRLIFPEQGKLLVF